MKNSKKRLLIAGGGYADIPLIQAAKKLSFHVITSGNRETDLGHKYSDECHLADFSNPDEMLVLAKKLNIDAICACSNDFSAISSAYVAEQMGLPGHDPYEISKLIHHKDLYRAFALENSITTPYAVGFGNIDDALTAINELSFPLIIKPVDLTGGKGISTIRNLNQAKVSLTEAFEISRVKRVVVEEFVEGTHHGMSVFLHDKHVVFYFSDNEHYFINPYMVSAASTPGKVPKSAIKKLCFESERIAELLSLETGILHIQYILRGDEPVIIEICRRSPGDLYTKFVQLATGIEYASWIVKAATGLDCSGLSHTEPSGYFSRHCVMSDRPGIVKDVNYHDSIKNNVIEQFMWWKPGDEINDEMTSKLGIVFLQFNSMDEMLDKTERMQDLIKVTLY